MVSVKNFKTKKKRCTDFCFFYCCSLWVGCAIGSPSSVSTGSRKFNGYGYVHRTIDSEYRGFRLSDVRARKTGKILSVELSKLVNK